MKKRFRWDVTYLYWGITAFSVIFCGVVVYLLLDRWPSVRASLMDGLGILSPIIYGLMFAYLLNKIMTYLEKKLVSRIVRRVFKNRAENSRIRISRALSVTLTIVFTVLLISSLFTLVLPQIFSSLQSLVTAIPSYFNTVVIWLQNVLEDNSLLEDAAISYAASISSQLTNWIQNTVLSQVENIAVNIIDGAFSFITTIANLIIGFIISIYVMYHKEKFSAQSKKVVYGIFGTKKGNKIIISASFLDRSCGNFITARLIDALIIGTISYIFLAITRMPYPMLIAVLIGITNIIPFFGPFIGAIPSAILILLVNPTQCLIFVIFILILQQLDGNVIYPKIQGTTLGLSGFWIIFSLLVFSGFFGFWGMLLGVPIFTVIYAACRGAATRLLESRSLPTETDEYKNIFIFDEESNEPVYKTRPGLPDGNEASADDKKDN